MKNMFVKNLRYHFAFMAVFFLMSCSVSRIPEANPQEGASTADQQVTTKTAVASGEKMNRLKYEKSPYLLQHAENPIWWYAWGDAALAAAKREDKPIFLSIGYSSCYWCHFMEKDSFEKQDVADVLNASFISIKVDREERPDVDHIYMRALVGIKGSGGWPLTILLTPEGKPIFASSTMMHDQFIQMLNAYATGWKEQREYLENIGIQMTDFLDRSLNTRFRHAQIDDGLFIKMMQLKKADFDETYAGFGTNPKFPMPHHLSALLRVYRRSGDTATLSMVTRTLKAMARGGMHDILGGGFHRYSVDQQWNIPHFEKMLYDNAGLIVAYLEAYQITKDPELKAIAKMTMDWVIKEMTHPSGGFYSSMDAGEFKEEGDYYAWETAELKKTLNSEEYKYICKLFSITERGNFVDAHSQHKGPRTVLHVAAERKLPDLNDAIYASAHKKMMQVRSTRERPRLDNKILTAWNGIMIGAMAKGYQVLGEQKYLDAARKAATFIKDNLQYRDTTGSDTRLYRRWAGGQAGHRAIVDDYAFMIHGLIELYQSDFDPKWFLWAVELQATQDKRFWDIVDKTYFFNGANDSTILLRTKDAGDAALPSGNSFAALNLLRLADFTYESRYRDRADTLILALSGAITASPQGFAQMLIAIDYATDESQEIAIVGPQHDSKTIALLSVLRSAFLPNKVVALTSGNEKHKTQVIEMLKNKVAQGGIPTAYVCIKGMCKLPTTDPQILAKQASEMRAISLK